MNDLRGLVRVFLVGIGCIVLIAMYCIIKTQEQQIIYVNDPNWIPSCKEIWIPSCKEIQIWLKALNDPRYDPGPIDGIPGPKMRIGWDNYICDQCAIQIINEALEAETKK